MLWLVDQGIVQKPLANLKYVTVSILPMWEAVSSSPKSLGRKVQVKYLNTTIKATLLIVLIVHMNVMIYLILLPLLKVHCMLLTSP